MVFNETANYYFFYLAIFVSSIKKQTLRTSGNSFIAIKNLFKLNRACFCWFFRHIWAWKDFI